jgi:signal peptidase I
MRRCSGNELPARETLLVGDHLLADTSVYGFRNPFSGAMLWRRREPTRGELIVFIFPEDRARDFLKRVIGLPGETIEIRNKRVLINVTRMTRGARLTAREPHLPRMSGTRL